MTILPLAIDPEKPQRSAADPSASVWVAASAGTGKTKVLTDRVLGLLLAGTPARAPALPDLHQGGGGGDGQPHRRTAGPLGHHRRRERWPTTLIRLLGREPDRRHAGAARGGCSPRSSTRRAACISRPSTPSANRCCAASRWRPVSPRISR